MVNQGAELILTTSADFEVDTTEVAALYPDVAFINVSGDDALWGIAPDNLGNIMGQMEYGKMIAGCAAALKTQTGSIAYIGPLIDPETTRLVNSTYLGARYCYENYRGLNPDDLRFQVTWIGFWFNIPGVTLDPTEVVNGFFDGGADVVISGIDTTEAIVVAGQRAAQGQQVWAVPYDFEGACAEAPDICLGVPYFNWGPIYLETVQQVMEGTWEPSWIWIGPDWDDINNRDTSAVGYAFGRPDGRQTAQRELPRPCWRRAGGRPEPVDRPLNTGWHGLPGGGNSHREADLVPGGQRRRGSQP